jgi:hypothetical protein
MILLARQLLLKFSPLIVTVKRLNTLLMVFVNLPTSSTSPLLTPPLSLSPCTVLMEPKSIWIQLTWSGMLLPFTQLKKLLVTIEVDKREQSSNSSCGKNIDLFILIF